MQNSCLLSFHSSFHSQQQRLPWFYQRYLFMSEFNTFKLNVAFWRCGRQGLNASVSTGLNFPFQGYLLSVKINSFFAGEGGTGGWEKLIETAASWYEMSFYKTKKEIFNLTFLFSSWGRPCRISLKEFVSWQDPQLLSSLWCLTSKGNVLDQDGDQC